MRLRNLILTEVKLHQLKQPSSLILHIATLCGIFAEPGTLVDYKEYRSEDCVLFLNTSCIATSSC